ncbi:kinase-like domain-containing protein, partial [Mycena rebaudengoi]
MVSLWMSGGTVLKYIAENSPSAISALELICDVSQGLNYLHSANIVHGDLYGRNILMDDYAHARLTDFGLAAFIESDASIMGTTRGGSKRWMAPELFPPPGVAFMRTTASDVWAFGCVCCEIWSGGKRPFNHVQSDLGIFAAVSEERQLPYPTRPSNTRGQPMPDRLWDLVQWCWKAPDARPSPAGLVDEL